MAFQSGCIRVTRMPAPRNGGQRFMSQRRCLFAIAISCLAVGAVIHDFALAARYATVLFGAVPYFCRSSRFKTLPVPLLGKLSRNSTERGHLKCDSRERQNSKMSSSWTCDPGFKV